MFWRKAKDELEPLRKQVAQDNRDKEAARLNLQRSLRQLARQLEEIPLDEGMASIGRDLAGNKGDR